jgi:GAF domain-containing protein
MFPLLTSTLVSYRSLVVVPLLRHNEVVGTLGVSRRESVGFTVDDVAILQTFANQTRPPPPMCARSSVVRLLMF